MTAAPVCALLVFAKVPEAGAVKTRLTPPLAPADAARLYAAFLGDALAAFAAPDAFGVPGVAVRLYIGPSEAALPPDLVPAGVSVHAQRGAGLGVRMAAALDEAFAAGARRAVVIGTDHPTLPLAHVGAAFRALAAPGAVALGPSDDGGFYLLGLDRPRPDLFAGMTYSHAGVFTETHARAVATGAPVTVLSAWYDVDDASSLRRLAAEWQAGVHVGVRTAAALARLGAHLADGP